MMQKKENGKSAPSAAGTPPPAGRSSVRRRKAKGKTTSRKPGAQPGNKNAEKHGFFSSRFEAEEVKRLEGTERMSLDSEIDLLRVCMDRLMKELNFKPVTYTTPMGDHLRDGHYLQQLNTLSTMQNSLATLVRTHYLTKGKGGTIEKSITEALEELRLEMGL